MDMGFFQTVRQLWEDFSLWLLANKLKFMFTLLLAISGFSIGIAIFVNCGQNWWYLNRCKQAQLLLYGNFFPLFLTLLAQTIVILLLTYVSQMQKYLYAIRYFTVFFGCLYGGATLSGLFLMVGFVAVFYLLFYTLTTVVILLAPCFSSSNPTDYCKSIREAWCEVKKPTCVICLLSCARLLLLFLLLRPLSGSI